METHIVVVVQEVLVVVELVKIVEMEMLELQILEEVVVDVDQVAIKAVLEEVV